MCGAILVTKKSFYKSNHKITPIFDCVNEENEHTFCITKSQAIKEPIKKLKLKFTDKSRSCPPNCHTLPHSSPVRADAVLTSNRTKNNITLSVCKDCAKKIADALKFVYTYKKSYIDRKSGIIIKYNYHMYVNQRCSLCGEENSNCYDIHLGHCRYILCSKCERSQYEQFMTIYQTAKIKEEKIKAYLDKTAIKTDIKLYIKYNINPQKYNNTLVKNVGFSTRIINALTRNNINFISDLLKLSISDIKKIRNIGSSCIAEIEEYVQNLK